MSFSLNTPYSLYSIPAVYVTAFYPHFIKFLYLKKHVGFVNLKPRENGREMLEKKGTSQHIIDRSVKLAGAHSNGNETFPLWAVAVLAANYAGIEERTLNLASGAFITLRLLFNYLYINAKTEKTANARSVTFFAGIGVPLYLLVKAANKLRVGSRL